MATRDTASGIDLLVIGAGPGGYVAAIRAAQRGCDVTLVEKDAVGGTCLNYGCIPSKALLTTTGHVHDVAHGEEMGIYADPYVDFKELVAWKDGVVERLTGGVEQLCAAHDVTLVSGTASFAGPDRVVVDDGDERGEIAFDNCIVATGSRPIELPGFSFDDDRVLDSRAALALSEVPSSLVVVGAGYIGMELATVFARLGVNVSVVEMLDEPLPTYDADLVDPVRDAADDLDVEFHFGRMASEWNRTADGVEVVTEDEDGDERVLEGDRVLVAVGREPVSESLALDEAGVETDENRFVRIDEQCRTTNDRVFAIGDVAGEPLLAHVASHEGQVAAEVIADGDRTLDRRAVPAVVYTEPEIATVGLAPDEARAQDRSPIVGEFPFRANGRALTTGSADGFVRVVAGEDGTLIGAQAVGPEVSELIAELGLAVSTEATLADVASTIHAHPTLGEATMEAAENAFGEAIHTLNR